MAGEQKLKEEDVLLMEQEGANRMDLLFSPMHRMCIS